LRINRLDKLKFITDEILNKLEEINALKTVIALYFGHPSKVGMDGEGNNQKIK